jgi:hypothetical protein
MDGLVGETSPMVAAAANNGRLLKYRRVLDGTESSVSSLMAIVDCTCKLDADDNREDVDEKAFEKGKKRETASIHCSDNFMAPFVVHLL